MITRGNNGTTDAVRITQKKNVTYCIEDYNIDIYEKNKRENIFSRSTCNSLQDKIVGRTRACARERIRENHDETSVSTDNRPIKKDGARTVFAQYCGHRTPVLFRT